MIDPNLPNPHHTPASLRYHAVLFDLYGTLIDEYASATPGARERLAERDGAKWGIVTSAGARLAERLIAAACLPRPPQLVTGDDVVRNEPSPDGYLLAAQRLDVDPARTLAIEGSAAGIASAAAAGMDVVAVLYGRASLFARGHVFGRRSHETAPPNDRRRSRADVVRRANEREAVAVVAARRPARAAGAEP